MFRKNNNQSNFNQQMNNGYNDSFQSGSSNPYFEESFYGNTNFNNKPSKFDKLKKIFSSKIAWVIILFVVFLALLSTIDNSPTAMIKAYDNSEFDEAIKYSDKILSKNPNDFNALVYKGYSLSHLGDFEGAIASLKQAEKIDYDVDLYVQIGYINYELQEYEEAVTYLDKAIELDSRNLDAYLFKGYSLVEIQRYEEADMCADKIKSFYGDNAYAYNILGLSQTYRENYDEGIENFEKAMKFYEEAEGDLYEIAYINKAWALYGQQSYSECIEYCNSVKSKFPDTYDFPYYIGDCYSMLGDHEKAILAYEEANKLNPNDNTVLSCIAFEYYYLEEYDKSSEFVEKSLEIYEQDFEAAFLKELLVEAKKPDNERIVNFVKDNYLYFDQVKDFDQKAAKFLEKQELTLLDIYDFLESVRIKDDMYTYLIFDEYYDMLIEEELNNSIEHKTLSDNVQYVKINSFTSGIDHQFKSILRKLPNPQEQTLVIDLRDNPGGLTSVANNMLDFLLPECVTSYLVDRDSEIYTYKSDKNQMTFKHIYIYVNENSASSSELLTLGLKTYLNNVTVIGRPTVGKGVGQTVFESKKNKYMIFLVCTYWNIKEKNISSQKIQPDINIKGNELSNYINAMNKHISR